MLARFSRYSVAMVAIVFTCAPAFSQDTVSPTDDGTSDQIIVTGRVGAGELRKKEASYAITVLDDERLRTENPVSVAEIFKSVPGFWVEASGGEASNNIRARGIPRDGYSSIGFYEDGLPVQHDPGLGFLNADQSFRFDETYERVEVVRGGPSAIVASNAPAGLVNFITRRGGDEFEGLVKLQAGDYGLYRGDAWFGGPIGENLNLSVGGFYRMDDGVRDTQYRANKGGQVRATLSGEIGPGRFFLDVKHLDDNTVFFLPIPLRLNTDGDIVEVPGFDAQKGTFAGRATDDLTVRSQTGPSVLDLSDGTDIKLTQYTGRVEVDLGGGFELRESFRYRTSDTIRNGLFPSALSRASTRLGQVRAGILSSVTGATDVQFRYAGGGAPFDNTAANGNGLVTNAIISEVGIQLNEMTNDFRILKTIEYGNQKHQLATGVYFSHFEVGFQRFGSTILLETNENARPLDIVAVNAAGNVLFTATENGFTRYGAQFDNAANDSDIVAFYASDEWSIGDKLRIDLGARYEMLDFKGFVERKRTVNLGKSASLADDQVIGGQGVIDTFKRGFSDFGFTAGINYQFTPDFGLFGRYTQTFRLPNATDFLGSATRTDLVKEDVDLAEVGLKFSSRFADLFVTGFYTKFSGVRFTETRLDPVTGVIIQNTEFADTETWGVEAEGVVRPAEFFDVTFNATYQDAQFKNFAFTEIVNGQPVQRSFDGNQLLRIPEFSARVIPGINLFDGRLRAQAAVEYYGKRFADAANSVRLPPYTVVNASVRLRITENLELYAYGDNLTNEIGLTEGNPRAGQFVSGDANAEFFLARPILGRNFRASLLFRF